MNFSLIFSLTYNSPYFSAGAGLMVSPPSQPLNHFLPILTKTHRFLTLCPKGIGVALTLLRRSTTVLSTLAHRRLLVTLEIPSKDRSYPWFLEWMANQSAEAAAAASSSSTSSSRLQAIRSIWNGTTPLQLKSHQLAVETSYKQHENGSSEAMFSLVPGPGTHYFRYKGAWIQVNWLFQPHRIECKF